MKLLHALPLLALLGCTSSPAPADAARDVPDASLLDAPATDVPADVTAPRDTPDVPPAQRITAPYTRYVDPFIGTGGVGFGVGSGDRSWGGSKRGEFRRVRAGMNAPLPPELPVA